MSCRRIVISMLALFAAGANIPLRAQAAIQKEVSGTNRNPDETILPQAQSDTGDSVNELPSALKVLAPDAMSPQDVETIRAAWPRLQQSAAMEGFDLLEPHWAYRQTNCSAFPRHILLLFDQDRDPREMSMFSAVIPRNRSGAVHVLPLLRRGVPPYSGPVSSPIGIAIFNQLHPRTTTSAMDTDWLTLGICYAALTGVHVVVPAVGSDPADSPAALAPVAIVRIDANGATTVEFSDIENSQQPKQWELTFDKKGKLLKVSTRPIPAPAVKIIPPPKAKMVHPPQGSVVR